METAILEWLEWGSEALSEVGAVNRVTQRRQKESGPATSLTTHHFGASENSALVHRGISRIYINNTKLHPRDVLPGCGVAPRWPLVDTVGPIWRDSVCWNPWSLSSMDQMKQSLCSWKCIFLRSSNHHPWIPCPPTQCPRCLPQSVTPLTHGAACLPPFLPVTHHLPLHIHLDWALLLHSPSALWNKDRSLALLIPCNPVFSMDSITWNAVVFQPV